MKKKLKILLLQDKSELSLVENTLHNSRLDFTAYLADNKKKFLIGLSNFNPNIVIATAGFSNFDFHDAIKICQKEEVPVPFIIVATSFSDESAVKALKQGADDYIVTTNIDILPSSILSAVRQREIKTNKKLAEEALQLYNNELLKMNQELDRFVYSASHDLRAPLKSVLGLVKLSQEEVGNQNFEHFTNYLHLMEKSVLRLDNTIKDIINYSRNSRTDVLKEKINFETIITSIFDGLKFLDGCELIEKKYEIENDHGFVSDESRISVILNNLISNSVKYKNPVEQSPFVHVKLSVGKEAVDITISDNGIGIEKPYISKIFNMFYRATARSEGSGLGLYIVKETIEKLKGSIEVTSTPGEGTTFYIKLPNLIRSDEIKTLE